MQKKSIEMMLYSAAGIAAMLVILVVFNFIAGFARSRVDLTQEKAYTLSAGTKAILKKLDTPVKVRFYCTQGAPASSETVFLKSRASPSRCRNPIVLAIIGTAMAAITPVMATTNSISSIE